MRRSLLLLLLLPLSMLSHGQSSPAEVCSNNAFEAIAAFESYVDPANNLNAEWMETRCSQVSEDVYRMELVANCNDSDSSTTNTMAIYAAVEPGLRCATGPNKNASCNELMPAPSNHVSLSDEEFDEWKAELKYLCELYMYSPPPTE